MFINDYIKRKDRLSNMPDKIELEKLRIEKSEQLNLLQKQIKDGLKDLHILEKKLKKF